mgnify:FL=1
MYHVSDEAVLRTFRKGELREPTEAEVYFESDREAACLAIFKANRVDKRWLPTGSHNNLR